MDYTKRRSGFDICPFLFHYYTRAHSMTFALPEEFGNYYTWLFVCLFLYKKTLGYDLVNFSSNAEATKMEIHFFSFMVVSIFRVEIHCFAISV